MKSKVFIDGEYGTTGLQIRERIAKRADMELLTLDEAHKKDEAARSTAINEADFVFLCLPDDAAKQSVALCKSAHTRIIDCSTAHRCAEGWTYGFPELKSTLRKAIKTSKRVANPGCYASGALSVLAPLVATGAIPSDYPVTIHAISGYSGGGKKAIAEYDEWKKSANALSEGDDNCHATPRLYALTQEHKHLAEIQKYAGLSYKPIFSPYICNYYKGMCVTIPLYTRLMGEGFQDIQKVQAMFAEYYKNEYFVRVKSFAGEEELKKTMLSANTLNGTNFLDIFVYGNDERIVITATLDNLGKGASGSAIQCFNIMTGKDEKEGL